MSAARPPLLRIDAPISIGDLIDKITILEIKSERITERENAALWDIEDEIRELDARQDFGARFIELARAVYSNNDERSRIKQQINATLRVRDRRGKIVQGRPRCEAARRARRAMRRPGEGNAFRKAPDPRAGSVEVRAILERCG